MEPAAASMPFGDLDLSPTALLWALAAAIVTALVARYVGRAVLHFGERVQGVTHDLTLQAARIARYFVIVIGSGVVLAILGAPFQPILAALLIVVAGGLLMARGIADNFGAGLVLQTRRSIRLGDLIESCGYRGRVADLNSRTVIIETIDGLTVHLPNREIMDNPLVNVSTRGRCLASVQVRLHAEPGEAVTPVVERLRSTTTSTRGVLPSPRPQALVVAADPNRTMLLLQFWHEPGAESIVCSRVADALHRALTEDGRGFAVVWPAPAPPVVPPGEL